MRLIFPMQQARTLVAQKVKCPGTNRSYVALIAFKPVNISWDGPVLLQGN